MKRINRKTVIRVGDRARLKSFDDVKLVRATGEFIAFKGAYIYRLDRWKQVKNKIDLRALKRAI